MADEQVEAGDGAAAAASRDLANFIIDLSDEDCPDPSLHLAAYNGDAGALRGRLGAGLDPEARVRPFLATPLRLAATGDEEFYPSTRLIRPAAPTNNLDLGDLTSEPYRLLLCSLLLEFNKTLIEWLKYGRKVCGFFLLTLQCFSKPETH